MAGNAGHSQNIPADWFAYGTQKFLRLFGKGGERFQDDMPVIRTNPKRSRGMIRF